MGRALIIDDVSRRYGRRWALTRISLQIGAGEGWMIVGPNGSGKSTLLRVLSTALKAHQGAITFGGQDLWTHRATLRRHIAVLGHQAQVYDDLSAPENLTVWARLGGYRPAIPELLERVGLDPERPDPVRTFSAGMRRRLALARMLLKEPSLVLLDEPFTALDPAGRAALVEVAKDLRESGATLLMATHLPAEAEPICSHRASLESGQLQSVEELP